MNTRLFHSFEIKVDKKLFIEIYIRRSFLDRFMQRNRSRLIYRFAD